MHTMKAVVYDEPGRYEVRELSVPEPGPGEVLLRVLVAGVCGTDLHLHAGEFGPTYPLTPGQIGCDNIDEYYDPNSVF